MPMPNKSLMVTDSGGSLQSARKITQAVIQTQPRVWQNMADQAKQNEVTAMANSFTNSATSALKLGQQASSLETLLTTPLQEGSQSIAETAEPVVQPFIDTASDMFNDLLDRGKEAVSTVGDVVNNFLNSDNRSTSNLGSRSGSASSAGSPIATSPVLPVYVDAPLAETYGMDAYTAYQEALANTSHQREIVDLKRAGLNPILSASYGGSSVFSPNTMVTASSGSSGGSSGGNSAKKLDIKSFKNLIKAAGTFVGAATGHVAAGSAVGTILSEVLDMAVD